jgi:membrane-bound metal-dependent hydrolase YbcI (DUF457 family)
MANFKTHIGAGVILGAAFIVAGLIYSVFSGLEIIAWIFLAVLTGSFLPDLDLDEGVSFQIIFGLAAVGFAGMTFFNLYEAGETELVNIILLAGAAFLVVRFGLGSIFQKMTRHRGMFHSVPAAVLSGLMVIWLLNYFSIWQDYDLVLGLAVAVGYMGHLVLDEIYSSVNLSGGSLLPKKSLGSALKLYSSSRIATFFFYGMIFVMVVVL